MKGLLAAVALLVLAPLAPGWAQGLLLGGAGGPVGGVTGGGGGGGTWDPAVTHAFVTLDATKLIATRTGVGANSRVLSTVKCAMGSKCRWEFTPNFAGGAEIVAAGYAYSASPDDWIGSGGQVWGSVIYDSDSTWFTPIQNQGNPSFGALVSGTPVGLEIDNSTPASPVAYYVRSDGLRIGPFALPANHDYFAFQSCDSGAATGNGGTANFGPTWATPATAGYGQLS